MEDILIYTGVYGIMIMAIMNLVIVWLCFYKKLLTLWDSIWFTAFILGVSLLASAVFFRNITKMHQWYYPLIFASLLGLIGLFLRLSRKLIRRGK